MEAVTYTYAHMHAGSAAATPRSPPPRVSASLPDPCLAILQLKECLAMSERMSRDSPHPPHQNEKENCSRKNGSKIFF